MSLIPQIPQIPQNLCGMDKGDIDSRKRFSHFTPGTFIQYKDRVNPLPHPKWDTHFPEQFCSNCVLVKENRTTNRWRCLGHPSPELAEIILERDRVQERVRGLIIERDQARADLARLKAQGIVNRRPQRPGLTTNELEVERIRVRNCVQGLLALV